MVAENDALELQDETPEPTDEAAPDSGDVPEPEEAEAEPPAEQEDPLAELRQRVESAVTQEDFERLRQQLSSEIGRAQRLESRLTELSGANPLADIDPRLAKNEALLEQIADALILSDLTDDQSKTALRNAKADLGEAKSQRDRAQLRQELLAEVQSAAAPKTEEAPAANPQVLAASALVRGYAEAKGVDWKTIPQQAWNLANGETLEQAVTRVKGVVDGLASQDSAASRTAARRQAAGNGSPPRSGVNSMEADLQRLQNEGVPITETEKRKALARALEIPLDA